MLWKPTVWNSTLMKLLPMEGLSPNFSPGSNDFNELASQDNFAFQEELY